MSSSRLALETGPELLCSPTRPVRSSPDCQRTLCWITIIMGIFSVCIFLIFIWLLVGNVDSRKSGSEEVGVGTLENSNSSLHLNSTSNSSSADEGEGEARNKRSVSVTEYSNGNSGTKVAFEGELIFEENFTSFDLEVWQHEITMSGGGNWEFQIYDNNRSNSYVKNGKLYIKPTLTSDKFSEGFLSSGKLQLGGGAPADSCTNPLFWGCERTGTATNIINPIMSARVRTLNSFAFKYGKFEARAKLPRGDWLWPAIWLMPKTNNYGGWPASGEVDILESRGNSHLVSNHDNVSIGVDHMGSTLHYGPDWSRNGWDKANFRKHLKAGQSFDQDFHNFGLYWTPDNMTFSVDGEDIGIVSPNSEGGFWERGGFGDRIDNPWKYSENPKMAPFDQQFYIILNLAVGGTNQYFPDNVQTQKGGEKPWKNDSPQAMLDFWNARSNWLPTWQGEDSALQVDYIRVWAL